MRTIALFFLFATSLFAENITLENRTSYPFNKNTKMAVQWASSTSEVQDQNAALMQGEKLNSSTLKYLTSQAKVEVSIPKNAEYFRIVVWPKGSSMPELLTNWVDVIPNKTYLIKDEHLVPRILMSGMGC